MLPDQPTQFIFGYGSLINMRVPERDGRQNDSGDPGARVGRVRLHPRLG